MTHVVAAFDFDGTLTRRDTVAPFLVRSFGVPRVTTATVRNTGTILPAIIGRGSRDAAKAALLRTLFAGAEVERITAIAERYATHVLARVMRNDTLARLEWHRREGHDLVLITASLSVYAAPIANRLGIPTVFATRLAEDGATFSGELAGANMRGPEKARALDTHLNGADAVVWAYGDSAGDRELLARADHAVIVRGVRIPAAPVPGR